MVVPVDLTVPLRSLAPSLDADVLTVLVGTEAPLSGAAVARLVRRGSRQGVQNVLDRLTQHGLVLVQSAGSAHLYRLNREHLLAEAVIAAASARSALVGRLRSIISGWAVAAVHASLFGSAARGDGTAASDIDLLVVRPDATSPDDQTWQEQLRDLEARVLSWTGNVAAIFETAEAELGRAVQAGEPVIDSWRRDSVQVAGTALRDILGQVVA